VLFGTALTVLITSPATADSSLGSGFLSLGLFAESGGERVIFTQAATGYPDGFAEEDVPFSHAELTADAGHALSSAAWPGTAVGNIGSLIVLSGGPGQAAAIADPVRAEARSNTGPPTVTSDYPSAANPAIAMSATATATNVVADALMGGSQNATVGTFGTTHVTSTTKLTGASGAEATSTTLTEDLSLGPGGLISIGSVNSTAKVTTNGVAPTASGGTTVTNMKVAGFPVTVDQDGVHAQGQGGSAAAATTQINKALAQTQTQIFLTQPTKTSSPAGMTYDSGCLLMSFGDGKALVLLGGARATAGATLGTPFNPPAGGGPPAAPPPVAQGPTAPIGSGTTALPPAASAPLPQTAPDRSQAQLVANAMRLPGGALSPGWLIAALLGAGLLALGLWRLPDRLLEHAATPCPLGDDR
jgi:hypothetical protein